MHQRGRRGEDGGGIGANGDETRHADVEQPGHAPLQIESKADDRKGKSRGQEEGGVGEDSDRHARPPNNPRGLTRSIMMSRTNETAARHSAPTNCTVAASAMPMTSPPATAPGMLPIP